MKVLMYHRNLPPDSYTGVAVQVHHLGNFLASRGNEVTILTFTKSALGGQYQIQTLALPKIFKTFPWLKETLKRIIIPVYIKSVIMKLSVNFDICHIHGDGGFIEYGCNFVRTFYGSALREMQYSRTLKGKMAQFISFQMEKMENSRLLKKGISCGISVDTGKCLASITKIIPCMLSPEFSKKREIQKSPEPSLLLVGSIGGRKQGELGLELFYKLKKSGTNVSLTMICKNVESHKQYWEKNHSDIDRPHFLENLNEESLIMEYNKKWFFLNFSSYEGFGVGVIEAMSQGCVVISTNNAGAHDIINSPLNGVICGKEDFYNVIINLINNFDERLNLSKAAIETAKNYSTESVGNQYLEMYSRENA